MPPLSSLLESPHILIQIWKISIWPIRLDDSDFVVVTSTTSELLFAHRDLHRQDSYNVIGEGVCEGVYVRVGVQIRGQFPISLQKLWLHEKRTGSLKTSWQPGQQRSSSNLDAISVKLEARGSVFLPQKWFIFLLSRWYCRVSSCSRLFSVSVPHFHCPCFPSGFFLMVPVVFLLFRRRYGAL